MPRELANAPLVRLLDRGSPAALADAQLAERFAVDRDPEAFAVLVVRHGPLVMAVCRAGLDATDAEDAFQATFLVLLNRLGTFPVGPSLAGWLRGVARRTAAQVRRERARRRRREEAAARPGAGSEAAPERAETIDLVRREVDRLPERYRAAVVLCDLEGLTREEAALALGCPPGTVGGRLARARERLREGLERRGLDPSITPAIPAVFRAAVESASRSAVALGAGARPTPAAAAIAARIAGGWAVALKPAVAATLAAFCVGGLLGIGPGEPPAPPRSQQAVPPPEPPRPAPEKLPFDPSDPATAGRFVGRVVDDKDRPIPGARVFLARMPRQGPPDALGPVRDRTDAEGRFDFQAPDMTYEAPDMLPARREGFLVAAADGYAPDWVTTWGETRSTFHSHDDPVKAAALTMRLVRDVPIRGRLVDAEGRPVVGARVRLTSLSIPEGRDLDSYLRKLRNAFLSGPRSESISRPEILPGVSAAAVTDAEGRFHLEGLGAERLAYLTTSAPGFEDQQLTVATRETPNGLANEPKAGDLSANVVYHGAVFTAPLKPDPTVSISGVARDRETGEPIAGVRIGREWLGRDGTGSEDRDSAVTGPDGRFTVGRIRSQELEPPPPPGSMGFSRGPFQLAAVPEPGGKHLPALAVVDRREGLVIELRRGAPYRLKLVDEEGRPVEAKVEARIVTPNSWAAALPSGTVVYDRPVGRALRTAPGVYEGVAAFGPGAILVKTTSVLDLRPPSVDPKAFFAPGKTDWTEQVARSSFGDLDNLILGPSWYSQDDYAAIVLMNPPVGSGPLELSATVYRDRPRTVTILDPEGRPLTGVRADGLICRRHDVGGPPLRGSTGKITRLDPDRPRRIFFTHEARKLIGSILVQGDGDAPYTVTLQPWATVTGRIVEAGREGKPEFSITFKDQATNDPFTGRPDIKLEPDGRFRIGRLIPGLPYDADVYRNFKHLGKVFENLVLQSGETRDLGDVRPSAPVP